MYEAILIIGILTYSYHQWHILWREAHVKEHENVEG